MPRKSLLPFVFCFAFLAPGAALAGHGKPGLWTISTSMKMAMHMPPDTMAEMERMHMKMPDSQVVTSQVCMTQADVDFGLPPALSKDKSGCDTHVTARSATSMTADMVCRGKMSGTGHMQVAYNGAEHYAGSYSFNGTMDGQPISNSVSYRGDWVKADCGAVRPLHR